MAQNRTANTTPELLSISLLILPHGFFHLITFQGLRYKTCGFLLPQISIMQPIVGKEQKEQVETPTQPTLGPKKDHQTTGQEETYKSSTRRSIKRKIFTHNASVSLADKINMPIDSKHLEWKPQDQHPTINWKIQFKVQASLLHSVIQNNYKVEFYLIIVGGGENRDKKGLPVHENSFIYQNTNWKIKFLKNGE